MTTRLAITNPGTAMIERRHDAGQYWASVLSAANYAQFHEVVRSLLEEYAHSRMDAEEALLRISEAHGGVSKANRGLWDLADAR
jgi:hypothetical protein